MVMSVRFANLKTRHKVLLSVLAPLFLLGLVGGVALVKVQKIDATTASVDHAHGVLRDASAIVTAAVDMETGMRGFLLAGDEAFLAPYKMGEQETYQRIKALRETMSDDPAQVARLDEIYQVLRDWQADVTTMQIALRREIGDAKTMNDIADLVGEAGGKTSFDAFRGRIATFIERAEARLQEREAALEGALARGEIALTREALRAAAQSQDIVARAKSLRLAALDMETGVRGYLLAGAPEFLAPFEAGSAQFGA